MEPVFDQDSSLLNRLSGMTGPMSTNPSHLVGSNQQKTASYLDSDNQTMPNQNAGEVGAVWSNIGLQKSLLPTKRKVTAESSFNDSVSQQLSGPNKHMVQTEAHVNSPRLSQVSALKKKTMQVQSMTSSQGPVGLPNKRMMSISSNAGSTRLQTPKSKTAAPEVSPKVQNGSYEAVRSKMRETLAAALSIGNQNKEVPNADKSAAPEAGNVPMQAHVESQPASTTHIEKLGPVGKSEGQKPQYNYVMPDTDGSFGDMFFAKDELLHGNGLPWAWDTEVAEMKEVKTNVKPNPVQMDVSGYGTEQGRRAESGNEREISSPQELAFKIEKELFKSFGGVNKKYKEKGRSLMFNLKDPNNPELREKVLSAKISPERLCLMTPEELASKELSEWRMAKAEELDKMIVLPDSDVDVRRLVKKTHKGEYQVEVEQDDGVSVEVAVGSSSLTQFRPKKKKTDHISEKAVAEGEKSASEKPDTTTGLTVSTDGTDIMQELIVDEFKDEGLLPPIVSLDEFMDSLNSEPPFENLPVDAKETKALSGNEAETCVETCNEKASSPPTSVNPLKAEGQTDNGLSMPLGERKLSPSFSISIGECLWEGGLQLTLSSAVSVIGLFRSGEKTSMKEWPGSVEIKGRVRLLAFEKFLQELPMSRSRAVMVVHFVLKDVSSEYHRYSLSEAVDSYVAEERVGFGEPSAGVEVYFCPPHKRITEMLTKLLSKDQTDILKTTDDGLIGVVVWRRTQPSSAMLPNSSSHHKHHRKHYSSRRQEIINANTNTNSNTTSKSLHFGHDQSSQPNDSGGDDDDDIPPGFGPGVVTRDVDDLPEFSFSSGSNSTQPTLPAQMGSGSSLRMTHQPNHPRPVAQMKQLVHEYGQTGNNITGTNWNKNRPWSQEDDDIPEWQPQPQPQNHHQPELSNHNIQGFSSVHLVNQVRPVMGQTMIPVMPIQQPFNLMQNGWVQPLPPHGLPPNAVVPGQHYSGQWRPDDPRGRGF